MATQWTAGLSDNTPLYAATLNQIGAAWETWTPTVSAQSGTITSYTVSARYARLQKLVFIKFSVAIANKGTAAGAMNITIPITAHSTYGVNNPAGAIGAFSEWTAVGFTGTVNLLNSTTVLALLKYDWTTPFVNGTISGFGVYEAA